MDCLLCSTPEVGDSDSEAEKNIKSLCELDYLTGQKYARSLCQLLELPSVPYQEYFLQQNIGFCLSCTQFVGTVTLLFEQLEKLQTQISESRDQVQQRLLECQWSEEGECQLHPAPQISMNILRQEIIKTIQGNLTMLETNLDFPIQDSQTSAGELEYSKNNLEGLVKEEVEEVEAEFVQVESGLPSPQNCCSPTSSDHSHEEADETQPSTSENIMRKRSPKVLQEEEIITDETIPTHGGLKPNKILRIVLRRLEESVPSKQSAADGNGHTIEQRTTNQPNSSDFDPDSNSNPEPKAEVETIVLKYNPLENVPVSCIVSACPAKLKSVISLRYHLRNVHKILRFKVKTQCPHCPKTYGSAVNLHTHIRIHTGEHPFVCDVCGKQFRAKWNLTLHMTIHTGQGRLSCPHSHCSVTFRHEEDMKKHIAVVHNNERSFMCELCSASFKSNHMLKCHQAKEHTKELNLNPLICRICDKTFASPSYLIRHENAHNSESQKYKCSFPSCSYRCDVPSRLEIHMLSHSEERNFKCPQCGKGCKRKGALKDHLKSHNEDRPHKCTECPASFKRSMELKRHIAVAHTNSAPFKCQICGKGFPVQRYLDSHIEKHTSGKLSIPGQAETETETEEIQSSLPDLN